MRLRLTFLAAALSAAATVAAPRPAPASLVIALDTPTMVQTADHIAVVDVVSVKAAWDDKHERILSTIDLNVVETWKGSMAPASHVKVVQPGGTVDDITMVVFGMTRFNPGERALVFLHGRTDAAAVVGMSQGKRPVSRETTTGRWLVHAPDRAGASFVRPVAPAGSGTTLPSPDPTRATPARPAGNTQPAILDGRLRALDDVRAEIRELVSKAPPR